MPEDERPPAAGDLTGWVPGAGPGLADALDALADADVTVEGRLPWSSNLTFLVAVDGGRQNWGEDWPGGIPDYFKVNGR